MNNFNLILDFVRNHIVLLSQNQAYNNTATILQVSTKFKTEGLPNTHSSATVISLQLSQVKIEMLGQITALDFEKS